MTEPRVTLCEARATNRDAFQGRAQSLQARGARYTATSLSDGRYCLIATSTPGALHSRDRSTAAVASGCGVQP